MYRSTYPTVLLRARQDEGLDLSIGARVDGAGVSDHPGRRLVELLPGRSFRFRQPQRHPERGLGHEEALRGRTDNGCEYEDIYFR